MAWGLIGGSLGHSFSPQIHALLGDYPYGLYPLKAEELPAFFAGTQLQGFNVTIPHKQAVMQYLQHISPPARRIGSVNTVWRGPDGAWWGDNTDAWGFARLLGDPTPFKGRKALVLGSGGASRTVCAVLEEAGIPPVVISRQGENHYGNLLVHRDAALIVNTTPVGMYPDNESQPLSLAGFPDCGLVLDLIYNPLRTRLVLEAQQRGIQARGGMLMLAAQAQRASELFGLRPEGEDISEQVAQAVTRRQCNIALIGMPGSGKSTVGRELAKLSGRPFVDTDLLVEQRTGMPIPEYFARHGEPAFRVLESQVLHEAAKGSGQVIATGGGVVTVPGNLPLLQQNSIVLYLQRDLSRLSSSGRPLSQGRGVAALFEERRPLYEAWGERIYVNEDSRRTARAIWEELL